MTETRRLPPLRDLVDQALLTLSDGAAITSAFGLVGLVWTVSQFYVTLDVAFARNRMTARQRGLLDSRETGRDERNSRDADHRPEQGSTRRHGAAA